MAERVAASDVLAGSADRPCCLRVVHSPFPGRRSRLCADFLAGRGGIAGFFGPAFPDDAALADLATRLSTRPYPRSPVATALAGFARETRAPARVLEGISTLAQPSAVTVFGGQQPGLFTGPLYTVYKALTVERWASDLAGRLRVPVVPCFWLADDDHDFAEVDHIELPAADPPARISYRPAAVPDGRPIGDLVFDHGMDGVFSQLPGKLPASPQATALLRDLTECYEVESGFSEAFARLWYRLFPESRLVFVPASDERLKELSGPLLARSALEHALWFDRYATDSDRLVALGYHRQVRKRPEQSFLFRQRDRRRPIVRDAMGLYTLPGGGPVTAARLSELVSQRPEDYSANVLLRPLVQGSLFPVLGVVLGPAETAYHAQIASLHDHLDIPRPAVLPRTSATIVGPRAARLLRERGVDLQALAHNSQGEIARVLGSPLPGDLDAELRTAAERMNSALQELGRAFESFDKQKMRQALRTCSRRTLRELERVARKARAIHRHQQRDAAAQLRSLAAQLVPSGELQERRFNIVWYRARYGPGFLRELHRKWPAPGSEHVLLMPE